MSARTYCADYFVWFGGSKNELNVRRWFFNNLEQRIEALWGNHVRFIQDENFVAIAGGRKNCTFAKIAGIVNTIVRGGVDFYDIE